VGILVVEDGVKRELLLDRAAVDTDQVVMQARIDHGTLNSSWGTSPEDLRPIGPVLDATYMSDEATRGFTGTMVGVACVDSYRKDLVAHFDWFDLRHGRRDGRLAQVQPRARAVCVEAHLRLPVARVEVDRLCRIGDQRVLQRCEKVSKH
jgi:Beta xylosidase C-terminal Concanavalin A-like domain